MRPERAAALLAGTPLFGGLDDTQLRQVADAASLRSYRKGQFVFHQGDAGDGLFVLTEGVVSVIVSSPEGQEMILATLRPPDVFGELAVIDGGSRSASVRAMVSTTALIVRRDTVLALLTNHATVADSLLRSLGTVVRRVTGQAADLVFLDLPARVAKVIVELAGASGVPCDGGIALDFAVTQATIAAMVGGSRQSVNGVIQTLEGEGCVVRRDRTIVVPDMTALSQRAAGVAHGEGRQSVV
jgi:CRP-like cAMP-binding protein